MVKVNYIATTGEIKGFYPDYIKYPGGVPEPYIVVDDAAHQDCINNPGLRRVDLTTKQIVVYVPQGPTIAERVETLFKTYDKERKNLERMLSNSLNFLQDTEYATEVIAEIEALDAQYITDLEVILHGGNGNNP